MHLSRSLRPTLAALALAHAFPSLAVAWQGPDDDLQAVRITAARADDLYDTLRNTVGVTRQQSGGDTWDQPAIRGIAAFPGLSFNAGACHTGRCLMNLSMKVAL